MSRLSPAQMQKACDQFNAKHTVGDTITVFTGLRGENPQQAQTRSPAQILNGHTAVVYTTVGGCIALTHVAEAA
jgi:hypothetical protein